LDVDFDVDDVLVKAVRGEASLDFARGDTIRSPAQRILKRCLLFLLLRRVANALFIQDKLPPIIVKRACYGRFSS